MARNLDTYRTLATIVALATAIVLGVLAIYRSRRDAHGALDDGPEDLYSDLKAAYEAGHMDTAEFRRVQASLGIEDPPPRSRLARAARPERSGPSPRPTAARRPAPGTEEAPPAPPEG